MSKAISAAAMVVAICLILSGCTTLTPSGEHSGLGSIPQSEEVPQETIDSSVDSFEVDSSTESLAIQTCQTAMLLFARPDVPKDQWDSELAPLMTDDAWEIYSYTDPARVPVREVYDAKIGHVYADGRLIDCLVATEAGDYTVTVAREFRSSPWLVTGFTPPESLR